MGDKNKHPVLVPTDFSSCSEAALLKGCELAACFKQPVVVLHVVHDPSDMPGYYSKLAGKNELLRIEDMAQELLDENIQALQKAYPDVKPLHKAETMLVVGLPSTKILQVAEYIGASMIVMGAEGRSGLERMLLGSTVDRVAHLSPIPVTIVKPDQARPAKESAHDGQ